MTHESCPEAGSKASRWLLTISGVSLLAAVVAWATVWQALVGPPFILMLAALAPAIFGRWMNVSGSTLASWWRERVPPGTPAERTAKPEETERVGAMPT